MIRPFRPVASAAVLIAAGVLTSCASLGGRGRIVPGVATVRATPQQLGAVPGVARRRIVGYFFGRDVLRGVKVADLRADRLTHLIFAFAGIGPDGRARLANPCIDVGRCTPGQPDPYPDGGVFAQLRLLKARYPHLRVLISIGGWSRSVHFSDAAASPQSRKAFIDSAVELFLRRYPGVFDGFDLDWEFPVRGGPPGSSHRPGDRDNFAALIEEFRARLDAEGAADHKHYELTIASPAGPGLMGNQDLVRMARSLDFFNVMCYNYHGSRYTYFNAPLFASTGDPAPRNNVDWTVRAYLELDIPSYKIVVGVPFYGIGYADVPPEHDGLFQPVHRESARAPVAAAPKATAPVAPPKPVAAAASKAVPAGAPAKPVAAAAPEAAPAGAPPAPSAAKTAPEVSGAAVPPAPAARRPWGARGFRYSMLHEAEARGFHRFWAPQARVHWLYDPATGVFINYDGPRSLKEKADYVRRNDLGGIMIWEIGQDTSGALLEAVWQALR